VPTTDWLRPSAPTRLHHVFERIAGRNEVHVLRFSLGRGRETATRLVLHEARGCIRAGRWPPAYYLANSIAHRESLRTILRGQGFDVMVLSNLLPAYAAARLRAAELCLFDLSDHFPLSGVEYLPGSSSLRFFGRLLLEMLLRRTLSRADLCVASSTTLAEYATRLGAKVRLITNGVDDSFLSQASGRDEIRERYGLTESFVVGFVGAVRDYHNFEPLLRAMKRMTKKADVRLLLVGPNSTALGAKLRKWMRDLRLGKRLVQVTDLPAAEVPGHIDAMDVCTIPLDPSKAITHFLYPNKLWEYLARGRPVAATPLGEIIREASSFIRPAQTEEEYLQVFDDCVKNPDAFEAAGRLAWAHAREHTWSNIASKYEATLFRLVAERT